MRTQSDVGLQPSLWRTCRVLANRLRLRMIAELFERPDQRVTAVATRLDIPLSVASKCLRDLNARGLLEARRVAGCVHYRPHANPSVPQARPLLDALEETFRTQRDPLDFIFRHVTAFTHPRRIVVVSAIARGCSRECELIRKTAISQSALVRHLRKLRNRGFLCVSRGEYRLIKPTSALARTLLRLALMPEP